MSIFKLTLALFSFYDASKKNLYRYKQFNKANWIKPYGIKVFMVDFFQKFEKFTKNWPSSWF